MELEMTTIVVLFAMSRAKQSPAGLLEDRRHRKERKKQKKKIQIEKKGSD